MEGEMYDPTVPALTDLLFYSGTEHCGTCNTLQIRASRQCSWFKDIRNEL